MKKSMLEEYMVKIKTMSEKDYLFGVILYSIAPTLAGHKPASVVTLSRNNGNLYSLWESYNQYFRLECEIDFYEIKRENEAVTLLFYDKEKLKEVIYKEVNMSFLNRFGYEGSLNFNENLHILKSRFKGSFPHEIGILLGYPLDDVICFIERPEKECLLCGYWKVYNNPEIAKGKFSMYEEDKNSVIRYVLDGVSPSLLIGNT